MKSLFLLVTSAFTITLALIFCFVVTSPVKAQTIGTPCSGCAVYDTYDNAYPYNGPSGDQGTSNTLPNCGNTSGQTCSCPTGYYTSTFTAYDCGTGKGSYDCQWYNHYYCAGGSVCQSPATSTVCNGTPYTDAYGNSCTGTEQPACVNGTPVCGGSCGPTSSAISLSSTCTGTSPVNTVNFSATNATTYNISRTPGGNLGSLTSPYTDSSLVQNTPYYYTLQACNATCASSVDSNRVTTSWCDTTPPVISVSVPPPAGKTCVIPTDLGANTASANATDIGGSGVKTVTFYIYDNNSPSTPVTQAAGSIVSCSDQNTAPGGGCRNGTWTNSAAFSTTNMNQNDLYFTKAQATDASGLSTTSASSSKYSFDPNACVGPFIKTGSGDVHSNQGINTPGGP